MESKHPLLSRKLLMTLLFTAIGLYLVVVDQLDGMFYVVQLMATLGIYNVTNVLSKVNPTVQSTNETVTTVKQTNTDNSLPVAPVPEEQPEE